MRWNNVLGEPFVVKCGVRQAGVLSPYLFAIYIDDLIAQLKQSGHGIYIEQLFVGCACYADDIALLSASCYGLQKLVDICSSYGISWDIKFIPLKMQLITFGGCNPAQCVITIRFIAIGCKYGIDLLTQWVLKKLCGESLLELWLCKTFYFYVYVFLYVLCVFYCVLPMA